MFVRFWGKGGDYTRHVIVKVREMIARGGGVEVGQNV